MKANLLEPEDYEQEFEKWRSDRSPGATARMLKTLDPVIDRAVQSHVGRRDPLARSRARRMAVDALQTFDPRRGRLPAHLHTHLRGLKRYAAQRDQPLKVPERLALDRHMLEREEKELESNLGRTPTDEELAQATGLSHRRLERIRSVQRPATEGFLASAGPEGSPIDPAVRRPGDEAEYERMWADIVYDELGPTDKKILEWSLGLHGQPQLSTEAIARRLGRSPGAVSQRRQRIQRRLDARQELAEEGF